jgi:hypothetical protein
MSSRYARAMSTKSLVMSGAVTALVMASILGGANAAWAEDPEFVFEETSLTAEYGATWSFSGQIEGAHCVFSDEWTVAVAITGAPSGYTPIGYAYQLDCETQQFYVFPAEARPLPVGQYSLTLTPSAVGSGTFPSSPPVTLRIEPAAVTLGLKIAVDPVNQRNAIVTTTFGGQILQESPPAEYEFGPVTPAGTWTVELEDGAGETVETFSAEHEAGTNLEPVTWFWPDAPAGDYTATARFAPTGASAAYYEFAQPEGVAFTAPGPVPGNGPTATPAPSAPPAAEDGGLTVPAWVLGVLGIIVAGLLAMLIVQIVRLARRRRPAGPTTPGVTA